MRAANITDAAAQGLFGFERFRRFAQGNAKLLRQATTVSKGYAKKAGVAGLAVEAGNAAWLASDADKRARVEGDFEANAKKPALERMVEGALNATDTLFATGKAAYDAGKTYESVERSQMDEINNSLLRKISKHEAEQQRQQQEELSVSTLAKDSLSAIVAPRTLGGRSPLRFNGGKPLSPAPLTR